MRIEIRPSSPRIALYGAPYMAFDADEKDEMKRIYGYGRTYEEALQSFLMRIGYEYPQ